MMPMIQPIQGNTNLFREPAVVASPAKREDPDIDGLIKKFAAMEAHIMDLEGQVKTRGYRHDNTRGIYTTQTDNNLKPMNKSQMTCHLCHKKGHFMNECWTRSWQNGQSSTGLNVITYESDK